ncbi:UvrD-helicase domain-containing protein [bacterium]|nr:UvrD-helicase domain-containing protein [bacterium]
MFHLYTSSAGSGKTFTLVREYLTLCMKNPDDYPHILAITFTNKAAAEMKNRIITSVHTWLSRGADPIMDAVVERAGLDAATARRRAEKLRELLLHRYSDLSVMTIDSFLAKIVYTFADDLDMPLRFDVELDTASLTLQLVDRLIQSAGPDTYTGEILKAFALAKIADGKSWFVEHELVKLGRIAFSEKNRRSVTAVGDPRLHDEFWRRFIASVYEEIDRFQSRVHRRAADVLHMMREHGLSVDDFPHGAKGAAGCLANLATNTDPAKFTFSKRLTERLWLAGNTPPATRAAIERLLQSGFTKAVDDLESYLAGELPAYTTHVLVAANIYTQALIHQFLQVADAYIAEVNRVPLLHFSDKVYKVVCDEKVKFLYWRLGAEYSSILIDEFQDTSEMQWQNLRPLVEESLANGAFCMAVGDGKQAIYRWRAGDVRIMMSGLGDAVERNCRRETLDRNFRSREYIVAFNNHIFRAIRDLLGSGEAGLLERLYDDETTTQKPVIQEPGFVRTTFIEPEEGSSWNETVLEALYRDIEEARSAGGGYEYGDMAVLVRSNREAGVVASFLAGKNIDVISPGSLFLINSDAVRFIISVLSYTVRDDVISLYHMWHFRRPAESVFTAGTEHDRLQTERRISPKYAARKAFIRRMPLYEAVEEIIAIFGLNRRYKGFLQGLLDVILTFSENQSSDIAAFLRWWQDNCGTDKAALTSSEKANAVRISTIHKAKGLEFPLVFIPFSWNLTKSGTRGGSTDPLWVTASGIGGNPGAFPFIIVPNKLMEQSLFRDDLEEERSLERIDNLNLLYVALTRAGDELYLYLPGGEVKGKESGTAADLLRACIDFPEGTLTGSRYEIGRRSRKRAADSPGECIAVRDFPSASWRNRITVKRRAGELICLQAEAEKERIGRGMFMHDLLAEIRVEGDIEAAVEQRRLLGQISSEEKEELAASLHALMQIAVPGGRVADWFRPGITIVSETAIFTGTREYRPDRVILDNGRAVVIDYKTGKKDAGHSGQVETYAALLRQMGYAPVTKYLLYIDLREVEEV